MSAKKLLSIKIAGLAAGLLAVLAYALWTVEYRRRINREIREGYSEFVDLTRGSRTAAPEDLAAPYRPELPPEYRHAREYIDAMKGAPQRPRDLPTPHSGGLWTESCLRSGTPYDPFGLQPDARGWPDTRGFYVVFLYWRDRLSPAARAEYVRRCLAGAADQWLRYEQYGGSPHWALGYLFVAYNASDSAYQREEIARQFYNRRLIYRGNWVRNNGPARGTIKADEFVLVDWDLLQAGRGEAAAVPDPLLALQPGSR